MVGTWMLCKNGRTLCGCYHGCHKDALPKRTESFCTLSWLPHGCSAKMGGVLLHVIMVATCMLCGTRRSLWERYHGWHMDALQKTAELFVDVIMVATWMLCKNGRTLCGRYHGCHMDALSKRTESFCTLSWLPHGYSAKTDGVLLHVIMVATWMLCGTRRSLSGRSQGWHMGALWERTDSLWTSAGQSKQLKTPKKQNFRKAHTMSEIPKTWKPQNPPDTESKGSSLGENTRHTPTTRNRPRLHKHRVQDTALRTGSKSKSTLGQTPSL